MEEDEPRNRLEHMGDDDRTDETELEEAEDAAGEEDDDVEAHSVPLPPPRPMNGL